MDGKFLFDTQLFDNIKVKKYVLCQRFNNIKVNTYVLGVGATWSVDWPPRLGSSSSLLWRPQGEDLRRRVGWEGGREGGGDESLGICHTSESTPRIRMEVSVRPHAKIYMQSPVNLHHMNDNNACHSRHTNVTHIFCLKIYWYIKFIHSGPTVQFFTCWDCDTQVRVYLLNCPLPKTLIQTTGRT